MALRCHIGHKRVKYFLLPSWRVTSKWPDSNIAGMATGNKRDDRGRRQSHLYIKEWRETRGLSDEDLAGLLGCDRTSVWRWETGRRNVSTENQAEIARVLDLDMPSDLWRPPDTRPSIDAMLAHEPDDLHETVAELARRLIKRTS